MSHDSSEIILIYRFTAQDIFLIIINVENNCTASYLVEMMICFNFSGFFDE